MSGERSPVLSDALRDRLRVVADRYRPDLTDRQLGQLAAYLQVLARWNKKINLTALEIGPDSFPDGTLARLIGEPLHASATVARLLGADRIALIKGWVDIGSGSGSPAIPLKVALPSLPLTMVESRGRKASFLREAAREASLEHVKVYANRVEDIADVEVDLVSMRGVRLVPSVVAAIDRLLAGGGDLLLIGADDLSALSDSYRLVESDYPVQLFRYAVPRGT